MSTRHEDHIVTRPEPEGPIARTAAGNRYPAGVSCKLLEYGKREALELEEIRQMSFKK